MSVLKDPVPASRASRVGLALSLPLVVTACANDAPAQLVISNARIVVGTGAVIERGVIVVRDGTIETVEASGESPSAERSIDADGATVLPGLIDVHRHFLPYSGATNEAELREYIDGDLAQILEGLLAAGLTTVMSPGDGLADVHEIQRRIGSADLTGPRLLTSGPVFTAPGDHPAEGPVCAGDPFCRDRYAVEVEDPETARGRVRELAGQGADFIKVAIDRGIVPGVTIDDAVLEAITSEALEQNVPVIVHAENADDAARAVALGANKLVHTPAQGAFEDLDADQLEALRRTPMATTVSWTTQSTAAAMGDMQWGAESDLHQMLANIRYLKDQGGVIAFGTDNPPPLGLTELMVEVEALSGVLSPAEVIEALTIGAARYLEVDDRLGSVEPGKVADLVIVQGNPLESLAALREVLVVVTSGEIVVDRR